MATDVDPRAWQQLSAVALAAAHGDERTALAMLQGCYVEMASRVVIAEQPSAHWLEGIAMFCQVASDRLGDAAGSYMGSAQGDELAQLAKLQGAQEEAARFAGQLRARFETFELTRSPDEAADLDHDTLEA